jgi:Dolichyl-phosphate-mannose-protein mannosyltransferase
MDTRFNSESVHPRSWILRQIDNRWLALALLVGLVLFQAYSYYRVLDLSLGPRVILQPWLMHQGWIPYQEIADQHTPLMPLLISLLVPFFSEGLRLAKIVLVVLLSVTTVLTFWASKRDAGWLAGVGAVFFFVCWSYAFGFAKLWHESFLTPLYLLFLIVYRPSTEKHSIRTLVVLGFASGIAILVKQQAIAVIAAYVLWNIWLRWRAHRQVAQIFFDNAVMGITMILPILTFGAYQYLRAGTLDDFLFWTLRFNVVSDYASLAALPPTLTQIAAIAPAFLLVPAALVYSIQLARSGNSKWEKYGWALILLAASTVGVYPRFAFFHLAPALPILAWLSSSTLVQAMRSNQSTSDASFTSRFFTTGTAAALGILWILTGLVSYEPVAQSESPRKIWEYSDLVPLAAQLKQHVAEQDCVYIFPDDEATANLYYLLQCPPPKFWVFHYPWYMIDSVQARILRMLQTDPPQWIVYAPGRSNIEMRAPEIMRFIQDNYQLESRLQWEQGEIQLLKRRPQ